MIDLGIISLSVFKGHPNLELLWVMVIVPFTLNSFQYWIQDNFLAGTEYIQSQKKNNGEQKVEMAQLYIMQDGMIDFKKNREQYKNLKGITDRDLEHKDIDSQIIQNNVEDEFVMVDKNKDPSRIRKSHIVRQIEENQLGIKEEDYNAEGQLDLEQF